jgi:uncharacterized protein (DUF2267 family)
MSRQEFLDAIVKKIVAGRIIDPAQTTESVVAVIASHVGAGEMQKVMHNFPRDLQALFRPLASAA